MCGNNDELFQNKKSVAFLDKDTKKAGGLQKGCEIDMFMFKNYPIDSIENVSLMFTWKYVYNSKYNNNSLLGIPFAYAYRGFIAITTHMSLPMSLMAKDILEILDFELKRNNNAQN